MSKFWRPSKHTNVRYNFYKMEVRYGFSAKNIEWDGKNMLYEHPTKGWMGCYIVSTQIQKELNIAYLKYVDDLFERSLLSEEI